MKREDFLKQKEELHKAKMEICHSIKDLELQYINRSDISRFQIGEKVRVVKRNKAVEGFVADKYVNNDGYPMLALKRCKKDGTQSKLYLPPYFPELGDRIEKIEAV